MYKLYTDAPLDNPDVLTDLIHSLVDLFNEKFGDEEVIQVVHTYMGVPSEPNPVEALLDALREVM